MACRYHKDGCLIGQQWEQPNYNLGNLKTHTIKLTHNKILITGGGSGIRRGLTMFFDRKQYCYNNACGAANHCGKKLNLELFFNESLNGCASLCQKSNLQTIVNSKTPKTIPCNDFKKPVVGITLLQLLMGQ